jgi:NADH pyrophosphatase NudC (nudix superfamily)
MRTLSEVKRMAKETPNDSDLGAMVRAYVMTDDKAYHRICIKCGRWQSDLNDKCDFCQHKFNMMSNED